MPAEVVVASITGFSGITAGLQGQLTRIRIAGELERRGI